MKASINLGQFFLNRIFLLIIQEADRSMKKVGPEVCLASE